jgi:spore coat polysaccharide biosynthesis predicted glycosyltransferase SpsG
MHCLFLSIGSSRKEGAITDSITIVTEGSPAIGFGHLRRSATLARALLQNAPVHLHILNNAAKFSLTDEIRAHLNGLEWHPDESLPENNIGVAILDLEQPNHQRSLEHFVPRHHRCLALDWFNPAWLPSITINLIDHGAQMRAAYAAYGRSMDYKEGPAYAMIRPGILALRQEESVADSVRNIVVTMGGADPGRRTFAAVEQLRQMAALNQNVTVIVGPLVPATFEEEIRVAAPRHFRFLRNPTDFDQQLAGADVVLCSGGGTLLESLSLGKPTVVFPQNEAEEAHARFHLKARACVFADSLQQVLSDQPLRNSLSQNAQKQVDGLGLERITKAALELLHSPPSV